MKVTENELVQLINEEIDKMIENDEIDEGVLDRLKAQAAGATATLNPFADKGDAALKKAASMLSSYSNHLLKLKQKLEMDAQKLGIDDADEVQQVSKAIQQTQQQVQQVAKGAPTSEKMKAAIQQKFAAQQAAAGGQEQKAAQPAVAPAPAAQPAAAPAPAAEPAAAPAASGGRQLSQNPRNVRRRQQRADKKTAAAAARPAAAASSAVNENKTNKGQTLNEQLQEISRRWGFGK